jgi:hypothetical protein
VNITRFCSKCQKLDEACGDGTLYKCKSCVRFLCATCLGEFDSCDLCRETQPSADAELRVVNTPPRLAGDEDEGIFLPTYRIQPLPPTPIPNLVPSDARLDGLVASVRASSERPLRADGARRGAARSADRAGPAITTTRRSVSALFFYCVCAVLMLRNGAQAGGRDPLLRSEEEEEEEDDEDEDGDIPRRSGPTTGLTRLTSPLSRNLSSAKVRLISGFVLSFPSLTAA